MTSFSRTSELSNENVLLSYLKGLIVSLLISFAFVILFAFCLKWFDISENYIFVGTMIIKVLSAMFGAMVAIKGKSKGLIKGLIFGIVYISIAFIVFSFLAGSFTFDGQTALDFLASSIIGGIVGVIKVNK